MTESPSKTPLPSVRLARPTRLIHPWVFGKSLQKPESRIPPGSVTDLVDPSGAFIARGFYNGHARIGFRVLTRDPGEAIDRDFFRRKIGAAIAWRQSLGLFQSGNVMRLIHGEGDGLSGLIIDQYDKVIAIEWFSAGMFRQRQVIKEVLSEFFPEATFYWFAETRIQKQESFDCWAMEPPPPVTVRENGLTFRVDIGSMHKTGFFADQRDNRQLLASHCKDRRVLDLCCHSGGFAVYAQALGGARSVHGVDLDPKALEVARDNARLNNVDVTFEAADVYAWLRQAHEEGRTYDVIILDPAKQTRSVEEKDGALAQYVAMNRLAMQVLAPGGILLTCSCSGLITESEFLEAIRRAAVHVERHAQIFRLSGAAPDHPFLAEAPEGRYLKAVWARVL